MEQTSNKNQVTRMSRKKTIIVIQRRNTQTHKWEEELTFEANQVAEVSVSINHLRKTYPGMIYQVIQRRVRND